MIRLDEFLYVLENKALNVVVIDNNTDITLFRGTLQDCELNDDLTYEWDVVSASLVPDTATMPKLAIWVQHG